MGKHDHPCPFARCPVFASMENTAHTQVVIQQILLLQVVTRSCKLICAHGNTMFYICIASSVSDNITGYLFCFCIPVIGCSMSISGCRVFISGCRQTERGGGEKRTALAVSPSSCVCPLIMCMNVWVVFKIPFVLGQRLIQPAVDDFELPRKFSRTHRPSQFIALIHKC